MRIVHAHFFSYARTERVYLGLPRWLARRGVNPSVQWVYHCGCGAVCKSRMHINAGDRWEVVSYVSGRKSVSARSSQFSSAVRQGDDGVRSDSVATETEITEESIYVN